jgi:Flp pilus assembly protein TadD
MGSIMTARCFFRPRFYVLAASFSALMMMSACSGALRSSPGSADMERILEEVKGPEVPGMKEALLNGAKQAEAARNYASAAQFYGQLVEKYPDEPEYAFQMAEAMRKAGAYEDALVAYTAVEAKEDYRIRALEGAGLTMMAQGDFDEAGDKLADVMAADTTRWRTINAIGILFTVKQMYPEARQYFAEAMVQAPKNVAVRNNMGLMEALAKQYDEAVRLLKEAGDMAGKDPQQKMRTDLNLALVYAIKGDLQLAERAAMPHLTEAQLLNNMGYYAYLAEDDQLAKSYLNMALTSSPRHYEKAWQNLETLNKLINNAPSRR